jgi:hypothetical protein
VDAGKVKFEYDNAHNRTWKKRYGAAQSETAVPAESWQSTYNALNQLTVFRALPRESIGGRGDVHLR